MATHYEVDEATGKQPRDFMDALRKIADAWAKLTLVRGVIIQLRDGADGSQDVHYTRVAETFGYATTALAKASFEELDTNWAAVNAKIVQLLERHL